MTTQIQESNIVEVFISQINKEYKTTITKDQFLKSRNTFLVQKRNELIKQLRDSGLTLVTIGNILNKKHETIIWALNKAKEVKESLNIIQCDMEGNEIKRWPNISTICFVLKINQAQLSNCLNHPCHMYNSSGGFKWKYVD